MLNIQGERPCNFRDGYNLLQDEAQLQDIIISTTSPPPCQICWNVNVSQWQRCMMHVQLVRRKQTPSHLPPCASSKNNGHGKPTNLQALVAACWEILGRSPAECRSRAFQMNINGLTLPHAASAGSSAAPSQWERVPEAGMAKAARRTTVMCIVPSYPRSPA